MNVVILIGFKNCGKTTIGKLIAQKLNCEFIDTDSLIEKFYLQTTKENKTVREIFTHHGEEYLRECEKKIIERLNVNINLLRMDVLSSQCLSAGSSHACVDPAVRRRENMVIATGGGTVLAAENVQHLKKLGQLVYLKTPFPLLKERAPQYLGRNFETIYNERLSVYPAVADKTIETEDKSILQIANEILAGLSRD